MTLVRLKIDVSGTEGDEAWRKIRHFEQIERASFGFIYGSSGTCRHSGHAPHPNGEWIGAEIQLQSPLLAQYAVAHYLKQPRVLDVDVVD